VPDAVPPTPATVPRGEPADLPVAIVGFARTLRAAGVAASPDRVHQLLRALQVLDPARRSDVYWAGRLTLCGNRDELERYDRAFAAYFSGDASRVPKRAMVSVPAPPQLVDVEAPPPGVEGEDEDTPVLRTGASAIEALRHRDIAGLTEEERAQLDAWLAAFALPGELRRTRRHRPAHRGRIDQARTIRDILRAGGESGRLRHRTHRRRPRRVVLLVDVSGSMDSYASALLRFAHAATRRRGGGTTEVFTVGTRLTRVTTELGHRDPDRALAAAAGAIPDWSGGTRLGELLKAFLDRWGQRGTARGAVVVIMSDGWERGDAAQLGDQMARLHRLAHRVVWSNPRKGRPGYAPLAAGMAAALPHVDDFVEGHSLAALERLARVVAGAARRQDTIEVMNRA
jgi:uncharacterized protein